MSNCYNSGCGSESYNGKHFAEHFQPNNYINSSCYMKLGAMQGWQCPVCGYIWGPFVQGCQNCNKESKTEWSTSCTCNSEQNINLKG